MNTSPLKALLLALLAIIGPTLLNSARARADELHVGPGQRFDRLEPALQNARSGDAILVHPRPENAAYDAVALCVRVPNLTIRAIRRDGEPPIPLSGKGADCSGVGPTPRAIVQFDPQAHGGTLDGFTLTDARNHSHNAAGVRINQANDVTIRRCEIHGNDMGIMSGGDGTPNAAVNQLIEHCRIHHNGAREDPGYNHNLYLGGTSVRIRFSEISHSLTGHNVKSRAHVIWVEYSFVHDSANREFDLVDAAETAWDGSHAVLLGNHIVKDPACPGNRGVIHFGQDGGGAHDGTLFLVHNTITTPFIAPVVTLSTPAANAILHRNLLWDGGVPQAQQIIAAGPDLARVRGAGNLFGRGFAAPSERGLDVKTNRFQLAITRSGFRTLEQGMARPTDVLVSRAVPVEPIALPRFPGRPPDQCMQPYPRELWEYLPGIGPRLRSDSTAPSPGAFAPIATRDPP